MNNVHDNGYKLLGTKKDIIKYIAKLYLKNQIESDDLEEISTELKEFEDDDIICINYDNGMDLLFDYWTKKDKIIEVGE